MARTKAPRSSAPDIKRERKKSLYFREISSLLQDLARDEKAVQGVYVTHVDLSPNSGILYIYFSTYTEPGQEIFDAAFPILKLYKPSLRKAFSHRVDARYTPELVFVYDKVKEKERRVVDLLEMVADDLKKSEH